MFSATVSTKNRDLLLRGEIATHFFDAVLELAEAAGPVSSEHHGGRDAIEAWASQKQPDAHSLGP